MRYLIPSHSGRWATSFLLLLALVGWMMSTQAVASGRDVRNLTLASIAVENELRHVLLDFGITADAVVVDELQLAFRDGVQWNYYYKEISLSGTIDFLHFERELLGKLAPWKIVPHARESGKKGEQFYYKVRLAFPDDIISHSLLFYYTASTPPPAFPEGVPADTLPEAPVVQDPARNAEGRPVMAIVLDDAGYNFKLARAFVDYDPRLALSILPKRPYSREIARYVNRRGGEYLLHLPMEPLEPEHEPGWGNLRVSMTPDAVRKTTLASLEALPGSVGVNNHMGSRFTQEKELMEVVLQVMAEKNLFFLDSYTSNRSQVAAASQSVPILLGVRDIFLDNEDDVASIMTQLERLADRAYKKGFAIGIGHVRSNTLTAIKLFLASPRGQQIELITPRELITRFPEAPLPEKHQAAGVGE